MLHRFTLILLTLLAGSAGAAAPRYHVEVLFFQNTAPANYLAENWPADAPIPNTNKAAIPGAPHPWVKNSTTYRLKNIAARLRRSSDYKVLKHLSWIQPGLSEERAIPVNVSSADNRLMGTVKIALGRYLHTYTDLVLNYSPPTEIKQGEETILISAPNLITIPIQQHRRMRSRTLHYLDHPLLGMLVQITPLEN